MHAVWNELDKENKEFFEFYFTGLTQIKADRMSEAEFRRWYQSTPLKTEANDHRSKETISTVWFWLVVAHLCSLPIQQMGREYVIE